MNIGPLTVEERGDHFGQVGNSNIRTPSSSSSSLFPPSVHQHNTLTFGRTSRVSYTVVWRDAAAVTVNPYDDDTAVALHCRHSSGSNLTTHRMGDQYDLARTGSASD